MTKVMAYYIRISLWPNRLAFFREFGADYTRTKAAKAKPTQCGCTGCTNPATHTWSGHPTCDDCATPSRKARMEELKNARLKR